MTLLRKAQMLRDGKHISRHVHRKCAKAIHKAKSPASPIGTTFLAFPDDDEKLSVNIRLLFSSSPNASDSSDHDSEDESV